jgi:hypothetical protein
VADTIADFLIWRAGAAFGRTTFQLRKLNEFALTRTLFSLFQKQDTVLSFLSKEPFQKFGKPVGRKGLQRKSRKPAAGRLRNWSEKPGFLPGDCAAISG